MTDEFIAEVVREIFESVSQGTPAETRELIWYALWYAYGQGRLLGCERSAAIAERHGIVDEPENIAGCSIAAKIREENGRRENHPR
jgi:hypothetical protein